MNHDVRSTESASTPISRGGYRYNPDDPQDVADFAAFTAAELTELAAERDLDFSQHPAMASDDSAS